MALATAALEFFSPVHLREESWTSRSAEAARILAEWRMLLVAAFNLDRRLGGGP
jgi:hypothetical protein